MKWTHDKLNRASYNSLLSIRRKLPNEPKLSMLVMNTLVADVQEQKKNLMGLDYDMSGLENNLKCEMNRQIVMQEHIRDLQKVVINLLHHQGNLLTR